MNDVYVKISSVNTTLITDSGQFTLSLLEDGDVIAAKQFAYHISGNKLRPDAPNQIMNWVNSRGGDADNAKMNLNGNLHFRDAGSGTAKATVQAIHNGTEIAASTVTWSAYGGSGSCQRGNVHCVPK